MGWMNNYSMNLLHSVLWISMIGLSSSPVLNKYTILFERGLSFVGKDYLCHNLWDKYIEFEYSQEHWNSLASIYIQTLKFPTKKLHHYYESFRKLVAIWKEDIEFQGNFRKEEQPEHDTDSEIGASEDAEISHVINDLIDQSTRTKALQKYISVGEFFYQRARDLDAKVQKFEQNIRRPYFHVKPLDDDQLHIWHRYLDLVEMEGDFDWAVKLNERCLITCAHYPEFWMRYVDYVESKGGKELAIDALERATKVFLKNVPEIHLFNAWFMEKMGDANGALAAFPQCDQDNGSYFIDIIRRKANMERRMGNYTTASSIYKEALDLAAKKRPDILPMLYVHFARLQYMITDNKDAAREVLINGIQCVPHSKLLLKELIIFALMHDGARQLDLLDSVVAQALALGTDVSGGLSNKDREEISRLYLEFIDSCGSINDIRRAWSRHLKYFPHLVRVQLQSSLKKPAKADAMWKMVIEGRPDNLSSHPPKELDENHLFQLTPSDKVLLSENIDKSEQAICEQKQSEDGSRNLNNLNLMTLEVTNTIVKDESKANESDIDDQNSQEVVKDSKLHGIQEVQEQDQKFLQQNPESLDGHSLNPRDDENHNDIPSTSSPVSHRDNNAAETCNESPCPSSRMRLKNPSSILSPDHPLDKEGNQHRFNSSGKVRSRPGSPGGSEERLERSLSPRRRNSHGYLDDRRHRERSLSPRRLNSRWHSEDRWHRDRRHRRYPRYQDNSRGHRDGRISNQNIVVIGNKGKTQTPQQQSTGSASQTQLPVQPVAYPQPLTNQYMPINEQFANAQNSQSYNQMWQYYYYNHHQQQLLLQQPLGSQQQLQQMQPPQQLQQQMQNLTQQLHMTTPQQPQQTLPHQQQLPPMQYQQQQLYQQLHFQQQQTNEQPESQKQQVQLQQHTQLPQQHVFLQQQPQQQEEQIQKVHIQQQQTQLQQPEEFYLQQKQQQQQQSYQYQQAQQQQYLLYLQQLHQYQQSQQQPGLAPDQKPFQQQQKLPEEQQKELPELLYIKEKSQFQQDDGSAQVASISSPPQQDQGIKHVHGSTAGAPSQEELPEIEGTDI